jgi:hypothetical protein
MRELLLRDLERRIENQRRKVAEDRERVEDALTLLPKKALHAVGSREGLLISFSAGAAAAGIAPSTSSVVLWDLIGRFALEGLPDVRRLLTGMLRRRRETTRAEQ